MACQPSFNQSQMADQKPAHTGEEKIFVKKDDKGQVVDVVQAAYTASGNVESFKELKAKVKDIPVDSWLVQNLRTIQVDTKKYNHGSSLTNTQDKPDVLVLKYMFKTNDNITFTIPLEKESIGFYKGMDPLVEDNKPQLARATSENKKHYEVQAQCLDTYCVSVNFVIVNKNTTKGVGIQYSQKKVPMSIDASQDQKNFVKHLLTPSGDKLLKRDYAIVGPGGGSFSEVWMDVQDNRIIYFKTDIAFTGNGAIPISKVYLSKPKKFGERLEYHNESIATGELIGNDEENGDIWVQFKLNNNFYEITKTKRQKKNAEFAITTGDQTKEPRLSVGNINLENSYFNVKNPQAKRMSQQLSRYTGQYNSSIYKYIQAYIDIYTGRYDGKNKTFKQTQCNNNNVATNERAKLESFFNNMHPALSYLNKQFEDIGVAPEFSLLTVIESNYPVNYKIEQAYCKNKTCTAYGPFQITNGTAKTLVNHANNFGLSTAGISVSNSPQYNSSDYRNYLLPSAKMAAVYMKYFSKLLSNNRPELYAVAYNGGPGHIVDRRDKDSPEYLDYNNTTLEKLARFKPPKSCEYGFVDYGFKFLALKIISDNYKEFGFDVKPRKFQNFYHMNQVMKLQPQSI